MESKILYYINEVREGLAGNPVPAVSLELNLTSKCNLRCDWCVYEDHMSGGEMPFDVCSNMLHTVSDAGTQSVTITGGGEPTLHSRLNDIIDTIVRCNMQVGIVTNGTLLDRINAPARLSFVRVSLDAATPGVYRQIKKVDAFDRVVGHLRRVSGMTTIGISFVVCPENRDELSKAVELADDVGVDYIQFKPAWLNGDTYTDWTLPTGDKVIRTQRYMATNNLPCVIAGLVPVVTADKGVYFCCMHKNVPEFLVGQMTDGTDIMDILKSRHLIKPDVKRCPHCRYMNYAKAYIALEDSLIVKHKKFL